jgi:hypothetical protein
MPGGTQVINIGWPTDTTVHQYQTSGFSSGGAVVFVITVPGGIASSSTKGSFTAVEYNSPPSPRVGALSTTACDFVNGLPLYQGFGSIAAWGGGSTSIPIIQTSVVTQKKNAVTLSSPGTYYINLKNDVNASCGGTCDMLLNFTKPTSP